MFSVNYIVNSHFSSRTYILSEEDIFDRIWLVDCGDIDKVLVHFPGRMIEGVLLTHTHSDHIYGLNLLLELFPNVKIVTNEYGAGALVCPKLNISKYHAEYEDFIISDCSNVLIVAEGSILDILGHKCEVFGTPGHDPSCLCYRLENAFFSGDAFIPGVRVFTKFPYSNRKQAADSLDRIVSLSTGMTIYPGHELQKH